MLLIKVLNSAFAEFFYAWILKIDKMTINSEDKYFIALSSIEEISSSFIKTLIDIKGSVKSAWEWEEKDFLNSGLRKSSVQAFLNKRDNSDPDKLYNITVEKGINWLTFNSEQYPPLLKQIDTPPMILYYRGNIKRINCVLYWAETCLYEKKWLI